MTLKVTHLKNSPFTELSKAIASDVLTLPPAPPNGRHDKGKKAQKSNEIQKQVELNYKRRKIRLPWLFNNRVAKFIYTSRKQKEFQSLYEYYLNELRNFNPDVVLIWNGSLMPGSVLKQAAVTLGIQITYFEHGFFPGTIQVDNKGINGFNSVPTNAEFYKKLDNSYDKPFESKLNTRQQKNSSTASQSDIPFSSYIFVPMQVPSDMQILELSPWVKDMHHFYEILRQAANNHPELNFVIKEHPSFKLSIQKQVQPHSQIQFANAAVTETLIENSNAVITINSTVGIETISKKKPLISLGTAYYNIDGLTMHCNSSADLNNYLASLTESIHDQELRSRFLNFVKDTYLIKGTLKKLSTETMQSIKARILKQDEFHCSIEKE